VVVPGAVGRPPANDRGTPRRAALEDRDADPVVVAEVAKPGPDVLRPDEERLAVPAYQTGTWCGDPSARIVATVAVNGRWRKASRSSCGLMPSSFQTEARDDLALVVALARLAESEARVQGSRGRVLLV